MEVLPLLGVLLDELLLLAGDQRVPLRLELADLPLQRELVLLQLVVAGDDALGLLDELGRRLGLDAQLLEPRLEEAQRVGDQVVDLRLQLLLPLLQLRVALLLRVYVGLDPSDERGILKQRMNLNLWSN